MGVCYDVEEEVKKLHQILPFLILSQGPLSPCIEFEVGAHIVTAVPNLVEGMIIHPYTKETVQQFVRDGAQFEKRRK